MNSNKKPEKTEFKNNTKDIGKIVTIVFFTLAFLILLITLLLVYTPLKDILFKKPASQTEETMISKIEETATEEPSEEKKEETQLEEPTEEITTIEETVKPGEWTFIKITDAKHQGMVKEIDYENKIITIENANTGEIEVLDEIDKPHTTIIHTSKIDETVYKDFVKLEDIKVGYYIITVTWGDLHPDEPNPDMITTIYYFEEKWWND